MAGTVCVWMQPPPPYFQGMGQSSWDVGRGGTRMFRAQREVRVARGLLQPQDAVRCRHAVLGLSTGTSPKYFGGKDIWQGQDVPGWVYSPAPTTGWGLQPQGARRALLNLPSQRCHHPWMFSAE